MIELLCCLATWRLSSLFVNEPGPFEIFAKLRAVLGVTYDEYTNCKSSGLATIFCCIYCMSIWVSLPLAIVIGIYRGDSPLIVGVDWLAFSAGAIIVEKVVHG